MLEVGECLECEWCLECECMKEKGVYKIRDNNYSSKSSMGVGSERSHARKSKNIFLSVSEPFSDIS